MEIPELDMISRFLSLSGIGKVPQVYSFWKWGALILALVATFSGVITRIRLVLRFCRDKFLLSSGPQWTQELDDDDDDDDEDESCSSVSSENEEEVDEPTTSFQDRCPVDEVYSVAGSARDMRLRRRRSSGGDRFSWSELASGKSVVKLWDSIGLWSESDDESDSIVSIWDLNENQKVTSFPGRGCQIASASISSPPVVLSAGSNKKDNIFLGVFDSRIGSQTPAIYAEWRPRRGKVVGIGSGGVGKVYVREDVGGALRVGDMRNSKTPLENLTESDGDTWWDADAVIVQDELVDE